MKRRIIAAALAFIMAFPMNSFSLELEDMFLTDDNAILQKEYTVEAGSVDDNVDIMEDGTVQGLQDDMLTIIDGTQINDGAEGDLLKDLLPDEDIVPEIEYAASGEAEDSFALDVIEEIPDNAPVLENVLDFEETETEDDAVTVVEESINNADYPETEQETLPEGYGIFEVQVGVTEEKLSGEPTASTTYLTGAEFALTDDEGTPLLDKDSKPITITTASDKVLVSYSLNLPEIKEEQWTALKEKADANEGKITLHLTQTKEAVSHLLPDEEDRTAELVLTLGKESEQNPVKIYMVNYPANLKVSVGVIAKSADTAYLSGAKVSITDNGEGEDETKFAMDQRLTGLTELTLDISKSKKLMALKKGEKAELTLTQTGAVEDYHAMAAAQTITVTKDSNGKYMLSPEQVILINPMRRVMLRLGMVYENDSTEYQEGVKFRIETSEGVTLGTQTSVAGRLLNIPLNTLDVEFSSLTPSNPLTLIITQTEASSSYRAVSEPKTVTVSLDHEGTAVVEPSTQIFVNPRNRIYLGVQAVNSSGTKLAGATFIVRDQNGKRISQALSNGSTISTSLSAVKNLENGDCLAWTVEEIKNPNDNYYLEERAVKTILVGKDGSGNLMINGENADRVTIGFKHAASKTNTSTLHVVNREYYNGARITAKEDKTYHVALFNDSDERISAVRDILIATKNTYGTYDFKGLPVGNYHIKETDEWGIPITESAADAEILDHSDPSRAHYYVQYTSSDSISRQTPNYFEVDYSSGKTKTLTIQNNYTKFPANYSYVCTIAITMGVRDKNAMAKATSASFSFNVYEITARGQIKVNWQPIIIKMGGKSANTATVTTFRMDPNASPRRFIVRELDTNGNELKSGTVYIKNSVIYKVAYGYPNQASSLIAVPGRTASATVLNQEIPAKLTLSKKTAKIAKTKSAKVNVTFAKGDSVTVKSNNTKIATATYKSGKLTIKAQKKAGTAWITVTTKTKKKASVKVTVPKATTTKLTCKAVSVKKGKTVTLKPVVIPSYSDDKLTFTSTKKSIATVTSKGVVKGIKKGTTYITVKSGKKAVKVKVTVK